MTQTIRSPYIGGAKKPKATKPIPKQLRGWHEFLADFRAMHPTYSYAEAMKKASGPYRAENGLPPKPKKKAGMNIAGKTRKGKGIFGDVGSAVDDLGSLIGFGKSKRKPAPKRGRGAVQGSGFWEDFADGFKKGFTGTLGVAKDIVPLLGLGKKKGKGIELAGKKKKPAPKKCAGVSAKTGMRKAPVPLSRR